MSFLKGRRLVMHSVIWFTHSKNANSVQRVITSHDSITREHEAACASLKVLAGGTVPGCSSHKAAPSSAARRRAACGLQRTQLRTGYGTALGAHAAVCSLLRKTSMQNKVGLKQIYKNSELPPSESRQKSKCNNFRFYVYIFEQIEQLCLALPGCSFKETLVTADGSRQMWLFGLRSMWHAFADAAKESAEK